MSVSVLDASVAISALRASDVNHARAASHLAPLLQGIDSIVIPSIFDAEVVATLVRAGVLPIDVRRAAGLFLTRARVVTLGPRAARAPCRGHGGSPALKTVLRSAGGGSVERLVEGRASLHQTKGIIFDSARTPTSRSSGFRRACCVQDSACRRWRRVPWAVSRGGQQAQRGTNAREAHGSTERAPNP